MSKKYSIRFLDPDKNEVLRVARVTKTELILDKNNFNAKGIYQFQLYDELTLVEFGDVLAEQLSALYQDQILVRDVGTRQIRVCITDLTDHFERLAHQLMAPEVISDLERVVL